MKAVSFFAGAGGLDIGLHKAGFNIILSVELEAKFCQTLASNFPDFNVKQGNIMDYNKEKIYKEAGLSEKDEIDLIFGGSPCQSFSTAGKRQAFEDIRGQAMLKFAEIIEETQPKMFLLENVRGLLSAALKHRRLEERGKNYLPLQEEEMPGSALKFLLNKFKSYNIVYKLVNAANYGVPQKRERVIIVGVRKDLNKYFTFPEETHNEKGTDGKQKWVPVGGVLEQLKDIEHHYLSYTPERLKYMKLIPKGGGNWRDLPSELIKEAMGRAYYAGGGKVGFFRRIKADEPAPTLLTSPHQKSTNLGHPFEDRPLSIEEYLLIQGFPLDYKLSGNLNDQYIQIGNAVPIPLAYIIGKSIRECLL